MQDQVRARAETPSGSSAAPGAPVFHRCGLLNEYPEGLPDEMQALPPGVPSLTVPAMQASEAVAIARKDEEIRRALDSPGAIVVLTAPWLGMTDDDVLGVDINVEFQQPVTLSSKRGMLKRAETSEGPVPHGEDGYPMLEPVPESARIDDQVRSARILVRLDTATVYLVITSHENQLCPTTK